MEQVLHKLPDGWKYQKLKTLIKMHYGKALKAVDRIEGDVPVYGSNGVVGSHNEHLWSQPTVVIGRKGSVGEANLALTPSWTIDTAYYVEIINQDVLDLMYFYHFADRFDVSSISQKGVKPGINRNDYLNLSFPLPPLNEQKRIVEKLDALLTRIDTAIEHLQESVTLADALSKNGVSEIFECLKDSYEVAPLSSVVKINSGIALPKLFKNGFNDGDVPFFKVAQMNNHHENMIEPEITFNETVAKEHKVKLFPKGSTLIPKRGGAILTNKKRMLLEDASYDSNIMGLKADEAKISDDYLFAFMRTIDLANFVDASTIPQVNNKHIDQMQISLASIDEQADVVSRVNLLVKKVEKINSEIQSQLDDLVALKNSILDSAFKGEL
ncbi:hypothetical protein HaloA020_02470 [Halomonas sp. A020]|uniref:restriction endonuclease subunit S n=1 Tax=Halomonas sp. A020 TaxID=2717374 RepID=UPI00248F626E|nr:restriction endonuclease subunit S [Halomonas sp. A020]BCB59546.1 hypothetical protein HaloA020_02470 [Halomonas sp. A020]